MMWNTLETTNTISKEFLLLNGKKESIVETIWKLVTLSINICESVNFGNKCASLY